MNPEVQEAVRDAVPLLGLFVVTMPDCLLFHSYAREPQSWGADEVAGYFGDLVRANREGLRALSAWSTDMQVTIESKDTLVILRELTPAFALGCVFERSAPLGLVRLHMKRLVDKVTLALPELAPEERPRSAKIIEFLERYAPEPHAIVMRVALRSGIPVERLREPGSLDATEVESLEQVACQLLGLPKLGI
jgi:predicted regulator of Ras-like GTPase activity (Roadblock/LC7/MglB family)